jgi:outer membrane receptor for ferrienterochelin and colicins
MGRRVETVFWFCVLILVVLISAAFPTQSFAQGLDVSAGGNGSLHGRVVDPHGLAVADAEVTARSVLSGASRTLKTAPDGTFSFTGLANGAYAVSATATNLTVDAKRIEVTREESADAGELRLSLVQGGEQIVVSGSRLNEEVEEAPTKVIVVTKDEIQNTAFERVGDVLNEVPGVVTRAQSFGVGLVGGEQIDGMDSKETLVLLDGLPFVGARGINEGYIDLNQQDVGKIERVEVVKGAASALYGSDALGGVINLVTKEPTNPIEAQATVSGGSLGEVDTRLLLGGQYRGLTGLLDVEHHGRDAYSLIPGDPTTVGAYENRQDLLFKARYAFNPRAAIGFTSSAYAGHDHGLGSTLGFDPNDPNNFTESPTALRSNDSTQTYAVTGDFAPTNSTSLQARFFTSKYNENSASALFDSNGQEGSQFDQGNLAEDYRRADVTVGQQWGRYQFIQGGYEWVRDFYRGDNRIVGGNTGQEQRTNDLWIQDRIQPFSRLLITLGARYQNNSSYGNHAVPKVGLNYRLSNHITLRGSFGQGFRAPNLGELYYHLLHLEYGYQVIGNPTLQPETSQSYSAGATYAQGRYTLSVNMFRNNLRNLINNVLVCDATSGQDCSGSALTQLLSQYGVPSSFDYDSTGAALFTFINLNVDRAYTEGFDVDGRVALRPNLVFTGAYTFLEAVDATDHQWLTNRNRHQGHIKLEYAKPRLGLVANIRGTFFSSWATGATNADGTPDNAFGYQIWSLYGSKELRWGVRAFGAIDNLADSRDPKLNDPQPSFDRPDYGRTFRIGLQYNFPTRER